jgi:hypothetical protein
MRNESIVFRTSSGLATRVYFHLGGSYFARGDFSRGAKIYCGKGIMTRHLGGLNEELSQISARTFHFGSLFFG